MMIYVDADACPVKDEVTKVAARHELVVTFVSNGGLRPSRDPMVRHVVVPSGADAADDWIVDNAVANDIAVTADVPLAARLVEKGVHVLGPTGRPFTPESIGMAVAMRDLKQHLRESGEIKGYNPGFSARDRSAFLSALDQTVRRALRSAAPRSQEAGIARSIWPRSRRRCPASPPCRSHRCWSSSSPPTRSSRSMSPCRWRGSPGCARPRCAWRRPAAISRYG